MAVFAFAWSVKADEITGLKLTISHNGGDFFEVLFPAEGWPDLDLTDESTTSIRIKRVEVQTSGTVSNVVFKATMYKTEKGLQPDDGWRTFDLPRQGNTWVLDFGDEAPDLIDSEMGPAPRTFQFFVQAQDGSGKAIYYNNGGQDYKVLFVNGGGSSSSGDIKNLTLTIRLNGGEAFTQDIPAENFPIVDLTDERTTSLIIVKVEVEAEESVSDLQFTGTMYSASEGGPSNDDEWRSYSLQNKGNGKWELDMGEGIDLVDPSWLKKTKTKTFEFYVQGTNGSGSQFLYDNGGAHYKVTFSTGEGADWKIKFLEESTADLLLNVGGEGRSYSFKGDGSRTPEDQLGQISSLAIDQFALWFRYNDGVKTNDVSLQYRVYEEGQEPDGGWSRIDAPQFYDQGSNTMFFYTDMMGLDVTNGLEKGKDYVLEVNYQVVVDGEYIFLGKNKEGSKFRFFLKEGGQGGSIRSLMLTLSQNDGEPEVKTLPASGCPEIFLEGQIHSLKIYGGSAMADESIQNLTFYATMYDTEDGGPWSSEDWEAYPLTYQGGGEWIVSLPEPRELIWSDWKLKHRQKTFEFYVKGQDKKGNDVYYNNDWQNYKITFTCGEGGSGTSGFKNFRLILSCNGEEFTQSFPKEGWDNSFEVPGNVSSIKLLRAEIDTDVPMSYVGFCWSIYDEEGYGEWPWRDFSDYGDGHWELDWGDGQELIESEWVSQNKRKTVVFFVQGGDYNGNSYRYDNGGEENCYRVTFTAGEGGGGEDPNWKVKFYKEGTASLNLMVNGQDQSYVFDGDASRLPDMQPGDAYSLIIDGFYVSFIYNDNTNVKDVSLQYKVYEEGQDGWWNGLGAKQYHREDVWNEEKNRYDHRMDCFSYGLWQDVTSGLVYGCDYVLEVMYQVVADGEYFFLGKDKESSKFKFHYDTETGISLTPAPSEGEGVYNLAGQRVGEGYKGIVVNKGKKLLRK